MECPEKEEWQEKIILWNRLILRIKQYFFSLFHLSILFPPFFKVPMLSCQERFLGDLIPCLNGILFGQLTQENSTMITIGVAPVLHELPVSFTRSVIFNLDLNNQLQKSGNPLTYIKVLCLCIFCKNCSRF